MQTPHDRFFRRVFADPEHAAGELRSLLPPAIVARIDWPSLRPLPTTFVDPTLSELRSDLLFSVQLAGREALIYVLMEHQSSADRAMALRLLGYLVRVWEDHLRTHPSAARLPAIVPIVVHHSDEGWDEPVAFEHLLDVEGDLLETLRPHLPCFTFLLDDLSKARDDDLRARAMSALGRVALWCLKRARGSEDLSEELARWDGALREIVLAPNGVGALAAVLSYLLEVSQTPRERLRALARALGPRAEEAYMTGAQLLRAEGREQGRVEGEAKALLKQLALRFGPLSQEVEARVRSAPEAQLERWLERVLTAAALADVFAE